MFQINSYSAFKQEEPNCPYALHFQAIQLHSHGPGNYGSLTAAGQGLGFRKALTWPPLNVKGKPSNPLNP